MSHFTCLVVGDDIEAALAPFHEFECTGTDNEFVQNIDKTGEARAEFAEATATCVLQRPDGSKIDAFDGGSYAEEVRPFYNESERSLNLPDGWKELRDEPASQWGTFQEWVESWHGIKPVYGDTPPDLAGRHKYGWCRVVDGQVTEVIDRTNPNARWDWWTLGGRWQGLLKTKPGAQHTEIGKTGVMGSNSGRNGVDACLLSELDIVAMKSEAVSERQNWIDEILQKSGLTADELETAIRVKVEGHAKWLQLAEPKPRGPDYYDWIEAHVDQGVLVKRASKGIDWDWPAPGDLTLRKWISAAPPLVTFAVAKDGQWYERGKMGWWANVSDEKDDWDQQFEKLFADLPPDSRISIVDCHI